MRGNDGGTRVWEEKDFRGFITCLIGDKSVDSFLVRRKKWREGGVSCFNRLANWNQIWGDLWLRKMGRKRAKKGLISSFLGVQTRSGRCVDSVQKFFTYKLKEQRDDGNLVSGLRSRVVCEGRSKGWWRDVQGCNHSIVVRTLKESLKSMGEIRVRKNMRPLLEGGERNREKVTGKF